MPVLRQLNHKALIQARKNAGDGSKHSAAVAAGLTFAGYDKWEKGKVTTRFDWNAFTRLCDYLGVSPEDITDAVSMPTQEKQLVAQHLLAPTKLSNLRVRLAENGHEMTRTRLMTVLRDLTEEGQVICTGRGRAALYEPVLALDHPA